MKLSFFIDAAILLLLFFFLKRKKLLLQENIFLLMILEFIVTSYCAILYINLDVWTIANRTDLFILFRIYEVVVNPVIWLLYFNWLLDRVTRLSKWVLSGLVVGIQVGIEQWMRKWEVIVYRDWYIWESILVHIVVLIITTLCLYRYRKMQGREKV